MQNRLNKHPIWCHTNEIDEICRPLERLNISYFSHVNVDSKNTFSALSKNPAFAQNYMDRKHYNADIHLAQQEQLGGFVVWDAVDLDNKSAELQLATKAFNCQHTFTIIEKTAKGSDFYHFATHLNTKAINQVYLSNLELLKKFISHFKGQVSQSKTLSHAYEVKFSIDEDAPGFSMQADKELADLNQHSAQLMHELTVQNDLSFNANENAVLSHKDSLQPIRLSTQKIKCLNLLVEGKSAKQIADMLNLSPRTVNHYLEDTRKMLGCRNSRELISLYFSQVNR